MTSAERAVINAAIRTQRAFYSTNGEGITERELAEVVDAIDALKHDDGCICPTDEQVYCESTGCRGGDDLPDSEVAQQSVKMWSPATIDQVRPGDRIRMAGRNDTAECVMLVSPLLRWHVHPAANPYRPNESRADWREIKVTFMGRRDPVCFKDPSFPVEIETTQVEADAVALLGGWGARIC